MARLNMKKIEIAVEHPIIFQNWYNISYILQKNLTRASLLHLYYGKR